MNSKGFSIIELVISTSIIAIVSIISFIGYRRIGNQTFLENQVNILASGIEETRSAALSAIKMEKGGKQVDYYTITIKEDGYLLYEDALIDGESAEKRYYFDGGVTVPSYSDSIDNKIGFQPPQPEIMFWDSDGNVIDEKEIEIIMDLEGGETEEIKIIVNRIGLVKIEK